MILIDIGRCPAQALSCPADLQRVQPATAESQRPGAVQADRDHLFIREDRLHILGDKPAIARQRPQEARGDVVERHVVIPGDDQAGKPKGLEKRVGIGELARGARAA